MRGDWNWKRKRKRSGEGENWGGQQNPICGECVWRKRLDFELGKRGRGSELEPEEEDNWTEYLGNLWVKEGRSGVGWGWDHASRRQGGLRLRLRLQLLLPVILNYQPLPQDMILTWKCGCTGFLADSSWTVPLRLHPCAPSKAEKGSTRIPCFSGRY